MCITPATLRAPSVTAPSARVASSSVQVLAAQPWLRQPLETTLRALLSGLQQLNGQQAFGVCRECAHFRKTRKGAQCGLTGEALDVPQTLRLCREWPAAA